MVNEKIEEFKKEHLQGFTWRSVLAIVFASAILLPVSLYLNLLAGVSLGAAAVYISAILFTEISSLLGSPLTVQEVFIVYAMAGTAATAVPFLQFVQRHYFMTSFLSWAFIDPFTNKPLPQVIKWWWAPTSPQALAERSFMHWGIPIAITMTMTALWFIQELVMVLICSYVYIERENLPFPFASIDAQMCITLADRPSGKFRIFVLASLVGIAYGVLTYAFPILSFGFTNVMFAPIPIPWVDLTSGAFGIENFLPGALFGLGTDLTLWIWGFLISPSVATQMLVGSLAIWTFGNHILLKYFPQTFPEWAETWTPGMGLMLTYQQSYLRVWVVPTIGFALGASILVIARRYRIFIDSFKSLASLSKGARQRGYFPLWMLLALYLGSTLASVALFKYFVPDFPAWVAILVSVGWNFFSSLVATRGVAETGFPVGTPYAWNVAVLLSGYPKVDAWFISPVIAGASAATPYGACYMTNSIKAAYLTRTRIRDWFKAYIVAILTYSIFSLIYVQFFWSLAPIPSSAYPWTVIQWPISIVAQGMWATRQLVSVKPQLFYSSIGSMIVLGFVLELVSKLIGIPLSVVSLVVGTTMLPTSAIPIFLSSIIGNYILKRRYGEEWWNSNRAVVVAGVAAGQGIVVGMAAGLVLIVKAAWIKPF